MVANDDVYNIPFSSTSQISPNILLNDTFNDVTLTNNALGLSVFIISLPDFGIIGNADGTLNIPAGLAVGEYIIKVRTRNSCLNSNNSVIKINIFNSPANNIISAPKRFSIHELCYKPYAYTTTQSIFTDVTIGGVVASAGSVSITTINAPAGFTINPNGTVNIPTGALPDTTYNFMLTLCPFESTVGCIVDVPLYVNIYTTLRPNGDRYSCGVSGNFLWDSVDPIFRNVITNDQYSNNCGLLAPNSFGPAIAGTNVTFQSGTFVPPNPYFTIDNSGLVDKTPFANNGVNTGIYNFIYTICDKNYPTVCKSGNGWVSVLSGARPTNNSNLQKNNILKDIITISPNPSDGIYLISFKSEIKEAKVEVYSLLGQQLFEETIFETNQKSINLNNFASGTYLIKIIQDENTFDSLIIKK